MNARSAQPSYAQSTDTSANPNGAIANAPAGAIGVKCPPVFGMPITIATTMMNSRPKYFATVVMFWTSEPHLTPT